MTEQQDARAVERNEAYFLEVDRYLERMSGLRTYRNVRTAIEHELRGAGRLLDIGNGGVFDYDVAIVDEIVAIDLFLDKLPRDHFPPNVTARAGSALDLPEPDNSFDVVLMALLIHHLTGRRASETMANAARALDEAVRVLRPGGRLVVVESCVPRWFYGLELMLYPPLRALSGTKLMEHPATLQITVRQLEALIAARSADVRRQRIPTGPLLLQFGVKWPTLLTPARPFLLVGTKPRA
ncbi:MAG TPA: class I SAM-dependent methyltransferase [Acidimicrobiia bacterium]|jgi:SAM-dependent methyltransferase|nr:class I SAM-dependent methyltransferase [Acidimicrobiia bacterium]